MLKSNLIIIAKAMVLLTCSTEVLAKAGFPLIAPITTAGVRYEAPHWSFQNACKTNGGCIEARDARSNQLLWYVQVYKVRYLPFLERDVQDVFVGVNFRRRG